MPVTVTMVPHVYHVTGILCLESLCPRQELEGAAFAEESVQEEDVLVRIALDHLHIQVDCRSWHKRRSFQDLKSHEILTSKLKFNYKLLRYCKDNLRFELKILIRN